MVGIPLFEHASGIVRGAGEDNRAEMHGMADCFRVLNILVMHEVSGTAEQVKEVLPDSFYVFHGTK